jgi:hypothetical protein
MEAVKNLVHEERVQPVDEEHVQREVGAQAQPEDEATEEISSDEDMEPNVGQPQGLIT